MPRLFCQYCGGENQYAIASRRPEFCSCCGVNLKTGQKPAPPQQAPAMQQPVDIKDRIARVSHPTPEPDYYQEPQMPQGGVQIVGNKPQRTTLQQAAQGGEIRRLPKRVKKSRSAAELRQKTEDNARRFGSSKDNPIDIG